MRMRAMKQFDFIRKEQYNCIENIWATLLKTQGIAYPLMFAENWGFTIFPPEKTDDIIGFRIGGGQYRVMECLSTYLGVVTKYYEEENTATQLALLDQELEAGHFVMIEADSYYFPWKFVEERHDFIHYGLIVGRDAQSGDYQCLDPFENSDLNKLTRENLIKGKLHCMTIRNEEPQEEVVWQKIVEKAVGIILLDDGISGIKGIKKLALEIKSGFCIAEEIRGFEEMIWLAPIIFRISDIGSRRLNFAECLRYLGENYGVEALYTYSKALEKLGGKWRRVRRIMVTSATDKQKDYIPMLSQIISQLADDEEQVAIGLSKLVSGL